MSLKPIFLFLLAFGALLFTGCGEGSAGDYKKEYKSKTVAGPDDSTFIEWTDPITQDLGEAKKGPILKITYAFENVGDKPLIIDSVAAGCGCTLFDLPEKPVAPGKKGEITVRYDTRDQSVNTINMRTVDVIANTRPQANTRLTFTVRLRE